MPIVTRQLTAGETAVWLLSGTGFSIVASGGASLSKIEFLRLSKTAEELRGSFGEGFFFNTPPGEIFDGVRVTAETSGLFSLFIGHGQAGIIETGVPKDVNVTNSNLAVDVQNAILNTSVTNSALDVDIITPSVTVDPNVYGESNYAYYDSTLTTSYSEIVTVPFSGTLSDVIYNIRAQADIFSNSYPTTAYGVDWDVYTGSVTIGGGTLPSNSKPSYDPVKFSASFQWSPATSPLTLRLRMKSNTSAGGSVAPRVRNVYLSVTK